MNVGGFTIGTRPGDAGETIITIDSSKVSIFDGEAGVKGQKGDDGKCPDFPDICMCYDGKVYDNSPYDPPQPAIVNGEIITANLREPNCAVDWTNCEYYKAGKCMDVDLHAPPAGQPPVVPPPVPVVPPENDPPPPEPGTPPAPF